MHSYNKNFLCILVILGVVVVQQPPAFCSDSAASAVELLTPNASPLETIRLMAQSTMGSLWQWFGYKKIAALLAVTGFWGYRRWQQFQERQAIEALILSPANKKQGARMNITIGLRRELRTNVMKMAQQVADDLLKLGDANKKDIKLIFDLFLDAFVKEDDKTEYQKMPWLIRQVLVYKKTHREQIIESMPKKVGMPWLAEELLDYYRLAKIRSIPAIIEYTEDFLQMCLEPQTPMSPDVKKAMAEVYLKFRLFLKDTIQPQIKYIPEIAHAKLPEDTDIIEKLIDQALNSGQT